MLLVLLPGSARSQEVPLPVPVRAAADRITAAQLARDLDYLSSDAFRGRNTPSPGFDSAAVHIARRLQRAGLTALGDNGTFFQHYELRSERVDTADAYVEIAGRRFRFGDDFVMRSFAGPLTGELPVVYAGHGWTVPAQNIDPYRGLDARGKIVLVHDARPADVQQIGRVTVGATTPLENARRHGAAGIIYIAQQSTLAGWDRLRRANTSRLELEPIVQSAYAAAPLTSLALRADAIEALLAGDRISADALDAAAAQGSYAAAFQLARAITMHIPLERSEVLAPYNVVALIEGSDPVLKHEYITIESHLDGAVGNVPQAGDSIYNAADDNASGSAGNLSIAEQMMGAPRPKRSLIFIWDSGEERGLWGTRHFVNAPPVSLANVVAHFNIDMISANRTPDSADSATATVTGPNEVYIAGPGVLSTSVDSLLVRTNRSYLNLRFNREHDHAASEFFYPRTDAGPFLERGVLTINFFTGLHRRYHAPSDEARHLDPAKMEAITRMAFASIWALANADTRPAIDRGIPPTVPRYR